MNNTRTISLTLSVNGSRDYRVSDDFVMKRGIRIVSLPSSLQTYENIKTFFEISLGIGKVNTIDIVEVKKAKVPYKTAYIGFENWYKNENTKKIADGFSHCEKDATIPVYINTPIHWENGSRMNHLSFRLIEPKTPTVNEGGHLHIKDDEWNSLYVPVIPDKLCVLRGGGGESYYDETLEDLVENHLRLGKISRIDYIDHENEGFGSGVVKTAYIHFEYWNNTKNVIHFRNRMNTDGQIRISDFYDGQQMNKLFSFALDKQTKMDRFVVFKINHLPITEAIDTTLNIHQIFAMKMKLEEEMIKRDNMIQSLIYTNNELIKCMSSLAYLETKYNDEKEYVLSLTYQLEKEEDRNTFLETKMFEKEEKILYLENRLIDEEEKNLLLETNLMAEEEKTRQLENSLEEEQAKNLLLETQLITDEMGDVMTIQMNDEDEEIHMMNIYNHWKYSQDLKQEQGQEEEEDNEKRYKWEYSMDRGRAERLDDLEQEQEQEQE
jgi:hypothetical protein